MGLGIIVLLNEIPTLRRKERSRKGGATRQHNLA
jgi:hypothetical protein